MLHLKCTFPIEYILTEIIRHYSHNKNFVFFKILRKYFKKHIKYIYLYTMKYITINGYYFFKINLLVGIIFLPDYVYSRSKMYI